VAFLDCFAIFALACISREDCFFHLVKKIVCWTTTAQTKHGGFSLLSNFHLFFGFPTTVVIQLHSKERAPQMHMLI